VSVGIYFQCITVCTLKKKLVEESKRYQYLKTEVKQSNANGILPNSLNIAKLVLVLLAPSIYIYKNEYVIYHREVQMVILNSQT
jgi:hypothetical protein